MKRRLAGRLVALAAAYAVALNTLLPVLISLWPPATVPGVGGGPAWGVICGQVDAGLVPDGGIPVRQHQDCPMGAACAMPGCGGVALPDAPMQATLAAGLSVEPLPRWHNSPHLALRGAGDPKLARGPPIA